MILKRALFNSIQSEWSKQHDRFPAAHEIVATHQAASKAASFKSFDRLVLGYWLGNFADWYEMKGKSIFFSHAGFESQVMRFS